MILCLCNKFTDADLAKLQTEVAPENLEKELAKRFVGMYCGTCREVIRQKIGSNNERIQS